MRNHILDKSVIRRRLEVYPELNGQSKTMEHCIQNRKEEIIYHILLLVFLVSILFPYKAYGNVTKKKQL